MSRRRADPPWAAQLGLVSERRRRTVIDRILRMRPRPVAELRDLARRHPNAYVRAGALSALIRIRAPGLPSILSAATRDPAMTVRMRVLGALTGGGGDTALAARLMRDASGGIRVNAIDAAAQRGLRGSAAAVRAGLRDDKWYVRQHAARAVGTLRDVRAIPVLRRLLHDPRPAVRREAAQALAILSR